MKYLIVILVLSLGLNANAGCNDEVYKEQIINLLQVQMACAVSTNDNSFIVDIDSVSLSNAYIVDEPDYEKRYFSVKCGSDSNISNGEWIGMLKYDRTDTKCQDTTHGAFFMPMTQL